MGIRRDVLDFILGCIRGSSYDGLGMLELGNQELKLLGEPFRPAKGYFEGLGFEHTSFDFNGEDGALVVNLSKPVAKKYHGQFDIITNSGTSEHIDGQFGCFFNVHKCCKFGGLMVHVVPAVGGWANHGFYHYTVDFFEQLADLNGYGIVKMETIPRRSGDLIAVCLMKGKDEGFRLPHIERSRSSESVRAGKE